MSATYSPDSRGHFCVHCGKTSIRHFIVSGQRSCDFGTANDNRAPVAFSDDIDPGSRDPVLGERG
ncbi:hypothetical protein sphantq_02985 [Sphingobium sp. AntQ-1]|nr:hypothetical protein sphantq_02985 [Sphingobium sp. AntQ-1]